MTPEAVIDLTEMVRLAMRRPERSPLFQAWEACSFVWIVSPPMLTEFVEVTNRPRLRRMIRPLVRDAVLETLQLRARIVTPATEFPPCRDPNDDIVVATAVAACPCHLVSADRDLYDDASLVAALSGLGVTVVRVHEFLNAL